MEDVNQTGTNIKGQPGTILAVGLFGVIQADHPYDEELLKFYSVVYGREAEIKFMGTPTRHLTFECHMVNDYKLVFTGCEVSEICCIPEGMHAWELSDNGLRIYSNKQILPVLDTVVYWKWKKVLSAFGKGFVAGDFTVSNLTFPGVSMDQKYFEFNFSENSYIDYSGNSSQVDRIVLCDPNPDWGVKFKELKHWLRSALGDELAVKIEHYGSTSISGLPAKPIIDILVEIPSFEKLRKDIVPLLCTEDCSYQYFMNNATFVKRTAFNGERIAHIHMAPRGHEIWKAIAFRDYLRKHHELALEYAEIKKKLASEYADDRNRYTMGKEKFIKKVEELSSNKID